ncbi:FliM/FliN family flagellar motor switch protein [Mesorhizobium sp. PUT5]|uniref:FliM/FliN family flagellar motor switch protein n=1 Tax=Mesorhizobium sp. PUT5 TaxID=3454629 RepID=UPI003FA46A38
MTGPGSASPARSPVIERLIGDSAEASLVLGRARSLAERALPALQKRLVEEIAPSLAIDLKAVEVDRTSAARAHVGEVFALTVVPSSLSSDALTMVMDSQTIAVVVCAMFGGDPAAAAAPIERELSPIETDVARLVFEQVAQTLNGSGQRSLDLRLPLAKALSGAEARRRPLRDGAAVRIDFAVSTQADMGVVSVLVPQRVLISLRSDAVADGGQAVTGADWRARFSEEVMRSTVRLEATMPLARLKLGELAMLEAGQVIEIEPKARSCARLSAKDKTLFICEFGKLGQNYTVRIDRTYDAGQELMDGLLPD